MFQRSLVSKKVYLVLKEKPDGKQYRKFPVPCSLFPVPCSNILIFFHKETIFSRFSREERKGRRKNFQKKLCASAPLRDHFNIELGIVKKEIGILRRRFRNEKYRPS
jgi:hypothetical protein